MTGEVRILLKERNAAFGSGYGAQYSAARTNLRRAIREAKTPYKRKIEDHLSSNPRVNPWKAAGPDALPGHVLKSCANQLAGVLTRILSQSLSQYTVPPRLESSVIVPVPKKD